MVINRRKLILFAEYVAVSASVVGAIVTITTQQSAYAIAPLSVASALNLVSRRQQARQNEEYAEHLLDQVQQWFSTIDQQTLAHQQSLDTLTQTVAQQGDDLKAAAQQLKDVRDDLTQQPEAILNGLVQQIEVARAELVQQIEIARAELVQQTVAMGDELTRQQALSSMESFGSINELSGTIQQIQALLRADIEDVRGSVSSLADQAGAVFEQEQASLNQRRHGQAQ